MAKRFYIKRTRSSVCNTCVHTGGIKLVLITFVALFTSAMFARGIFTEADNRSEGGNIVIELDHVDADENVSRSILLELMNVDTSSHEALPLSKTEPTVLIYHTHSTEAYFPTEQYSYVPSSSWRTRDNTMNIITVGEKLCALLNEKYGITAIHDITDHEPPKLSTAYTRSLETMLEYKAKYPSLELFIDLHRDAYGNDPQAPNDYIIIDGKECARIMFVVGTGENVAEGEEKPDFQSNYALAMCLSEYLASIDTSLVRNVRVKAGRYNQHVGEHCLLAEIGHNSNTLEQALNSVEYLARAIAAAADISYDPLANEAAVPTMLQLTP